MKTDPLVGKKKSGAGLLWLGLVMGLIALAIAGMAVYSWMSGSRVPKQSEAAKLKPSYLPRLHHELTGQYYCYSQFANLKPVYWQLLISQKSIYLTGEYTVLGSGSGTVSGTLDDRFNLQLSLSQGTSGGGPLSGLSIPGIGGGSSQSQMFVLMGKYSFKQTEILLGGTSENTTTSNEDDARPRRFYCSSYRPQFWGRS